jgi:hypothetical protein
MGFDGIDKLAISARLKGIGDKEALAMAQSFLKAKETPRVPDKPVSVPASEVLWLWETRLAITKLTGRPIYGCCSLAKEIAGTAAQSCSLSIGQTQRLPGITRIGRWV